MRSGLAVITLVLGCTDGAQPPADAGQVDGGNDASDGATGPCPATPCPAGSYCAVNGYDPDAGPPLGTCQSIPSFCKSLDVCTCNIVFCTGGGMQACASNTVYCP